MHYCLNAFIDAKAEEATTITRSLEDITAWKEKEEYTKKFAAKKNSVLEILAHDLAGPLNNLNLASSFVAQKAKASNDTELHQIVDCIRHTSERSIRLIREF